MFNGEGDPTIVIFEKLKKHLEAHKRKAQVWIDPKRILSFYKIQLGIRDATERHKNLLAQQPRNGRENVAHDVEPRQSLGRYFSVWSGDWSGMASSHEDYKYNPRASVIGKEKRALFIGKLLGFL